MVLRPTEGTGGWMEEEDMRRNVTWSLLMSVFYSFPLSRPVWTTDISGKNLDSDSQYMWR